MKNTTNTTINNYIEALSQRAEMAGDDKLGFAMGFLYGTLADLKLQSCELDILAKDTKNLNNLVVQS